MTEPPQDPPPPAPPEPPPPLSPAVADVAETTASAAVITGLRVATVPATHGWLWVLHGFALFRLYPAFWLLLLLFYWTLLLLVGAVPVAGMVVLILTVPALSAGFMTACQAAQRKTPPLPSHLFLPLRHDQRHQLMLGGVYLACMLVLMLMSQLIGGDVLLRLAATDVPAGVSGGMSGSMSGDAPADTPAAGPGVIAATGAEGAPATLPKKNLPPAMAFELRTGGLVALLLYTPVMLAFWFAPALCYWHRIGVGKALFFSFFAAWRNAGAFLVYGLGWMLFMLVAPMMAGAVLGAILPRAPQSALLVAAILVPYLLVVVCAVILSFYSTFTGVFGVPPAAPPPRPKNQTGRNA